MILRRFHFRALLFCAAAFATLPALAADEEPAYRLAPIIAALAQSDDSAFQSDLLIGMIAGTRGESALPMPVGWPDVYRKLAASDDAGVRERALRVALLFGDPAALQILRDRLVAVDAPTAERVAALDQLVARRAPDLLPDLLDLVAEAPEDLRRKAVRALAAFDDPAVAPALLVLFDGIGDGARGDAVQTLATRPVWAVQLLAAVGDGLIPRERITPFLARQIRNLGDAAVTAMLGEVWGMVRESSDDKRTLIHQYKTRLVPHAMADADASRGRVVFMNLCATCHTLYGEGGKIAPDLTGSNRADRQYLLQNVLDPNAVIGREYQLTAVTLDDGRVLTGTIAEESAASLTIQMIGAREILSQDEIARREVLPVSMMPEGLFTTLDDRSLRDIVAYLSTSEQVPLPAGAPAPAPTSANSSPVTTTPSP